MKLEKFLKMNLKKIKYLAEYFLARIVIAIFKFIGLKNSANLGSFLARFIGSKLKVNQLALKNISKALPKLSNIKKEQIINDMWDNLGRICAEFYFISTMSMKKLNEFIITNKETKENLESLKNNKKGGIIISGHIGNWEVGPKFFESQGVEIKTLYRPLNNSYFENYSANLRTAKMIKKSSRGNRQIIEAIKNGEYVIIMADQRISEGENIKFFHKEALTTTSIARIALKYNVPIIPACAIRKNKSFNFEVRINKSLAFNKTSNTNADIINLTRKINQHLEKWIEETPQQWFWVHDRWRN